MEMPPRYRAWYDGRMYDVISLEWGEDSITAVLAGQRPFAVTQNFTDDTVIAAQGHAQLGIGSKLQEGRELQLIKVRERKTGGNR